MLDPRLNRALWGLVLVTDMVPHAGMLRGSSPKAFYVLLLYACMSVSSICETTPADEDVVLSDATRATVSAVEAPNAAPYDDVEMLRALLKERCWDLTERYPLLMSQNQQRLRAVLNKHQFEEVMERARIAANAAYPPDQEAKDLRLALSILRKEVSRLRVMVDVLQNERPAFRPRQPSEPNSKDRPSETTESGPALKNQESGPHNDSD